MTKPEKKKEAQTIFQYYNTPNIPVITSKEIKKYAIYFDHKLADTLSTFPMFYSGLVPNRHNNKILASILPILNDIKIYQYMANIDPKTYLQHLLEFQKQANNIALFNIHFVNS